MEDTDTDSTEFGRDRVHGSRVTREGGHVHDHIHTYRVDGSRVTLEGGQQGPTVTVPHEDLRVHKSTQEHGGVRRRHAKKSEARSRGSWHVSWYVGSRHVGRHGEMST